MGKDEISNHESAKTKEYYKGQEEGIRLGIKYWDLNRYIHRIINSAAKQKDFAGKMNILSKARNYISHLYTIMEENPESKELKLQNKSLEDLAIR